MKSTDDHLQPGISKLIAEIQRNYHTDLPTLVIEKLSVFSKVKVS